MIRLPVTDATFPPSSAAMTARESRATRYSRPDAPLFHLPVRRLDESEIVDARERGQRCDQPDVGTFRRFDRTNAAVVRWMHVTHFEAGPVAGEPARPQGGEAALVGQLGQRIDLVHELGELA